MRRAYREADLLDTIRRNVDGTLAAFLSGSLTARGVLLGFPCRCLHRTDTPPPTPTPGSAKSLAPTVTVGLSHGTPLLSAPAAPAVQVSEADHQILEKISASPQAP